MSYGRKPLGLENSIKNMVNNTLTDKLGFGRRLTGRSICRAQQNVRLVNPGLTSLLDETEWREKAEGAYMDDRMLVAVRRDLERLVTSQKGQGSAATRRRAARRTIPAWRAPSAWGSVGAAPQIGTLLAINLLAVGCGHPNGHNGPYLAVVAMWSCRPIRPAG